MDSKKEIQQLLRIVCIILCVLGIAAVIIQITEQTTIAGRFTTITLACALMSAGLYMIMGMKKKVAPLFKLLLLFVILSRVLAAVTVLIAGERIAEAIIYLVAAAFVAILLTFQDLGKDLSLIFAGIYLLLEIIAAVLSTLNTGMGIVVTLPFNSVLLAITIYSCMVGKYMDKEERKAN